MTDILLYDAANVPSPRRVRMCLHEKGLSYRIKWLNLGLMDQKRPEFLAISPTGLVPALVHDGFTIYDSSAINEYLDAMFPTPRLTPEDPRGQAQMRMWFAFESDWAKPFRDAVYETMAKDRIRNSGVPIEKLSEEINARTPNPVYARIAEKLFREPKNEDVLRDRLDLILEKIECMERQLGDDRPWLCGDAFTLADIALAPRLEMFPAIGVDDLYARFPKVGSFVARVKERPSWEASRIVPEPGETERVVTVPEGAGPAP